MPVALQQPLDDVLLLEAADLRAQGEYSEALALFREVAAIRYAARGGAFRHQRIKDQFAVITAMVDCARVEQAAHLMRETFDTNCLPFGRSAAEFEVCPLLRAMTPPSGCRTAVCSAPLPPPPPLRNGTLCVRLQTSC